MKSEYIIKSTYRIIAGLTLCFCAANMSAQQRDIWISPSGNDANSGTSQKPLASLQKAWQMAKQLSDKSVSIKMMDGRYEVDKMILLENNNESHNITIKAVNPQKVILSGGKELPESGWKKIKKNEIYKQLNPSAQKNVWQINLKELGITDYGTLKGRGFSLPVLPMEMELFVDNDRSTLARWPNYDINDPYEGKAQYGKVTQVGSVPRYDDTLNVAGKFIFDNERIRNWHPNADVWLHGVWSWDWADRRMPLLGVDADKHELTVGCSYYGLKPKKYFYVVNAVSELDSPGEYYIDRNEGILYYWPKQSLKESKAVVSMIETPLLKLKNTFNVLIDGIIFQDGRAVGVNIVGGINNVLDHCVIRNVGSAALNIGEGQIGDDIIGIGYGGGNSGLYENTGWNRNGGTYNGIRNSHIYNIAAYGVLLGGGDRATLTPAHNFVDNCVIDHVARVYEQMFSNIHIDGVGNHVSHCDLSYNPHSAIMFWGNNHLIEYNEIHHCVYNSADAGAIYSGRDPSQTGTVIRWNLIYDIKGHENFEGIFFDDGASGLTVYGNVFHGIKSRGATKYHGGQDNVFVNNIVIDCSKPVDYQLWNQSKWNDFINSDMLQKRLFSAVNIYKEPYLSAYPWLSRVTDVPYSRESHAEACNYITTTNDPLFEDGKNYDFRIVDWQSIREKVPGMQIIPTERIGLKEKNWKVLAPVFYKETARLFPGETFKLGPSPILKDNKEYEIYYTTDGTTPDRSKEKFTTPITPVVPATYKARMYVKGSDECSSVKTLKCEKPGGTIYLDELYPTEIIAHNGLKMNHNYSFANYVQLGSQFYHHSVMACPTSKEKLSKLVYDMRYVKGNVHFQSDYGIDKATGQGSCQFIVKVKKGDETKELFKSKIMNKPGVADSFDINVSDCDELILIATDGGDGASGDHATWANARLVILDN